MAFFYNLLWSLTIPIWFPIVWFRAKRRAVQPNWNERWGNFPIEHTKGVRRVWIHAVSVGEVLAVSPILRDLRKRLPNHEIVLSVTTSSGHGTAQGENEKEAGLYDHLVYFPFDLHRCMLAAMQRVQPDVLAVMETELWMSLFWAAKVFDANTMLINGRISDRSYPRASKVKFWYHALFRDLDRCLMQTQTDADRITSLGAKNVEVLGNCKFDQAMASGTVDTAALRAKFGLPEDGLVLVIGSTRGEKEEALVLDAISGLEEWTSGRLSVIHAPRHLERVPALVSQSAERLGVKPALRSQGDRAQYMVLDTYGELGGLYPAADVVVIGGGFDDLGGQNIIQPLAAGKPVIHGPHMQNFRSAADEAGKAGATMVAADSAELRAALALLLGDAAKRAAMGSAAAALVRQHVGAAQRYAEVIAEACSVR